MAEGKIRVEDHLVDVNKKPIQVTEEKRTMKKSTMARALSSHDITVNDSATSSLTDIKTFCQAIINFDASYTSPDDEDGPTNLVNVIVQQNTAPGGIDDDQQMLLDIEQNIANLEKSLQKGLFGNRKHFKLP